MKQTIKELLEQAQQLELAISQYREENRDSTLLSEAHRKASECVSHLQPLVY